MGVLPCNTRDQHRRRPASAPIEGQLRLILVTTKATRHPNATTLLFRYGWLFQDVSKPAGLYQRSCRPNALPPPSPSSSSIRRSDDSAFTSLLFVVSASERSRPHVASRFTGALLRARSLTLSLAPGPFCANQSRCLPRPDTPSLTPASCPFECF